jgi:thioester reductase-like protein
MKNILLTGATGFVGTQVLLNLLNKEFKIHVIIIPIYS